MKVQGEFTRYRHADTGEFFLVPHRRLTTKIRDRNVVLRTRELFVAPRGIKPCSHAGAETTILPFEPGGVVNTGDVGGELIAEVEEFA